MKRFRLVTQSLRHYWRTNLAVFLGVVVGTAVIGGALIVGDSVRASLRQMTLDRLGKIDYALVGSRFVQESFADKIASAVTTDEELRPLDFRTFAPAIVMQAGLQAKVGDLFRRAGKTNIYGFDQRAWSLVETKDVACPTGSNVVLNARAAEAINAKIGDEVTIWIELPSAIPRDTLMGKKDNDSQEITLTVSGIAPDASGLGRLGLQPTQSLPLNAFVDLHVLQERLGLEDVKPSRRDPVGKPARINAVLAHVGPNSIGPTKSSRDALSKLIQRSWQAGDLNLRIVKSQSFPGIVLESEQMILEDSLEKAAKRTADELGSAFSPVMVYLANKLWNPKVYESGKRPGYSMYSTVAGLDLPNLAGTPFAGFEFIGEAPASWSENDVIINEFLATDLQVTVGDEFRFSYHTIGSRGELPEQEQTVTVRGIVKMTGSAIDRSLTPEVKGITDVDSLAEWDQPFPMNLNEVTTRDDEYWNLYRAIPKMFLPLKTAQKLWPSRYGSLTSLRIAKPLSAVDSREGTLDKDLSAKQLEEEFRSRLLMQIQPGDIGVTFQPVKTFGLMAASGSTDFSGLFFGFSLFLIVAAMILIGLLFRLGIEQRIRDLGLLGAVGFTPRQVRMQMFLEGMATACIGGFVGTIAAVGYAKLMIYGLTHWWLGAIGTKDLTMSVQPLSLIIGLLIAVTAAIGSIWWALRHLGQLSLREQLDGITEREIDSALLRAKARKTMKRAIVAAALAIALIGCAVAGVIPAAVAFFCVGILLLTASLWFLSAWLQTDQGISVRGHGLAALGRLGIRNASRQRQRTVMTAGMIATATFLIVAVAAFRRDPTGELPMKSSGNGGFTLVAESSSPLLYDINTADGRKKLQLAPPENSAAAKALQAMNVIPFRVKPGEDASCLNLYQTKVPTILGVPQSLIDEGRFAFASGSWRDLVRPASPPREANAPPNEPPIPVLGDMNTLMFSLHKQVGQTIALPNEESPLHQLIVKGMFQDSVLQGVLVMSEENFLKLFPEQKGFRYFLIEVPSADAKAASSFLETELAEYGFDVEPVAERLARFLSVQNTYLSTFQTLGGLGLLLGTFGLATVMLRNVLERQTEMALLRAVGFRRMGVASLVLWENAMILLWGIAAGGCSAILAVSPNLMSRGSDVPWVSLIVLFGLVFAAGMLAAAFAVQTAIRLPIVSTLRGD